MLFQKAGYYTCIGGYNAAGGKLGKTDYNFTWDPGIYNGNDWAGRKPGQPFFMQVQLNGGKYRGQGPNKNWQERVRKDLGSMDHLRCVRTADFKYIRNYLPERPHLQPNRYKDDKAIVKKLRDLHAAGKLDALTEKLLFAEKRPAEELYDLRADPLS